MPRGAVGRTISHDGQAVDVPWSHRVLQALKVELHLQGVLVIGLAQLDVAGDAVVEDDFGLLGLHAGIHGRVGLSSGFGGCGLIVGGGKGRKGEKGAGGSIIILWDAVGKERRRQA